MRVIHVVLLPTQSPNSFLSVRRSLIPICIGFLSMPCRILFLRVLILRMLFSKFVYTCVTQVNLICSHLSTFVGTFKVLSLIGYTFNRHPLIILCLTLMPSGLDFMRLVGPLLGIVCSLKTIMSHGFSNINMLCLVLSAKAEYRGVVNIVAQAAWLHNLLLELHCPLWRVMLCFVIMWVRFT